MRNGTVKKTVPSIFSAVRLLIALIFPLCPQPFWLWLVLAAGCSDLIDGWLARRWGVESWQGGLIDAIADKVFVLTVLIVLALDGRFSPLWIPAVILRDLTVLLTALGAAAGGKWASFKEMKVRVTGKLATGGQLALFVMVLTFPEVTFSALVFATLCSLIAAIDYGRVFIKELTEAPAEGKNP